MATYTDLETEWSMLNQDLQEWTVTDLQLAAELGKTLLERNKELESNLKNYQLIIADQAQEIEHLTKQTTALREVNDTRLRMYENIEISISDLERSNHRLMIENSNDKKHIKTLCNTIENLEGRCDELTKQIDELNQIITIERRKKERLQQENKLLVESTDKNKTERIQLRSIANCNNSNGVDHHHNAASLNKSIADAEDISYAFKANSSLDSSNLNDAINRSENELAKLRQELEMTQKELVNEQQRVSELEEQLISSIQDNQCLQGRLAQVNTNEEKSIQEELSILEEVRQGQMCCRCLRLVKVGESPMENGSDLEDDDLSLYELINSIGQQPKSYNNELNVQIASSPKHNSLDAATTPNSYRLLVQRYEALLEEKKRRNQALGLHPQDEFPVSSDYSSINTKDTDDENKVVGHSQKMVAKDQVAVAAEAATIMPTDDANTGTGKATSNGTRRKVTTCTPTDFSEVSSGFSDETSNKATQTEGRAGSFLCTITDGTDCKFSIYDDDSSPIDSRFRNRPEYRELFKEIFHILKKAAENREEGEKLPLLDDEDKMAAAGATAMIHSSVPPTTPATEEAAQPVCPSYLLDNSDTQSIASSSVMSEQSVAMSECITKTERKKKKKKLKNNQENAGVGAVGGVGGDGPASMMNVPYKRDSLNDYLGLGVKVVKKNRRNRYKPLPDAGQMNQPGLPTPPRFFYGSGRKRREFNPFDVTNNGLPCPTAVGATTGLVSRPTTIVDSVWGGNSMAIFNRNVPHGGQEGALDLNGCAAAGGGGGVVGGGAGGGADATTPTNGPPTEIGAVDKWPFRQSTASQDLQRLKKLEMTYAEVLRRADQESKAQSWKKQQQQQQHQQQPIMQQHHRQHQQQQQQRQHPQSPRKNHQRK